MTFLWLLCLTQKASEGRWSAVPLWYIMNLDQSLHKRQCLQGKLCITLKGPSADPETTWQGVRWSASKDKKMQLCKCHSCNTKKETLVIIEINYKNLSDKHCSFPQWPWDRVLVGWLSAFKQEYQTWTWNWARFGKLQPMGQIGARCGFLPCLFYSSPLPLFPPPPSPPLLPSSKLRKIFTFLKII